MRILQRDRQAGKTSTLIDWVLHDPDNRIVLLPDVRQRDVFVRRLWACWLKHGDPARMTRHRDRREYWERCVAIPSNLRLQLQGRGPHVQVSVDNLEEVLALMLGVPVDIATTSDPVLQYYEAAIG